MTQPLIVSLPGNELLCDSLVTLLSGCKLDAEIRRFPDEEAYLRVDADVAGRSVAMACTLDRPDGKMLQLLFLARLLRELGAARLGLVAPYLSYMRQDRRFKTGEAVTSNYFADMLSDSVDWLVTVDPHLHRHHAMSELYGIDVSVVHASSEVSRWIAANVDRPVLVGPDEESAQWVRAVAEAASAPWIVLDKSRHGDREVEISVPDLSAWRSHTPVLVDDIISTARTMIETARKIAAAGLERPVCVGLHAVFAQGSLDGLAPVVAKVVTCNTIPHATNGIDIHPLVAQAIERHIAVY
jgi:ribose-phosphate pyrophosphokinase